jgi:hypothetical protein
MPMPLTLVKFLELSVNSLRNLQEIIDSTVVQAMCSDENVSISFQITVKY